ncbi:hypothetical protein [Paraburkholderia sp. J8-2]|uniref:hypothetical protein n=1 Tax=Paraburkholderia sp. J8-2 TaxID=2805440 RepID=UPI002AB6CCA6|nr:hypothetical protein [Paraburkholderia sp. J8-2]
MSTSALLQLLFALTGPQYLIRELQATRGPLFDNPIDKLINEFNVQIAERRDGSAVNARGRAAGSPDGEASAE